MPLCCHGDRESRLTHTHTQTPIPSPKSPSRSRTHVSYRKRSSNVLINTLCPNTRAAAQLDTSGSEHVSQRSIQLGWAIKLQLIRVLVQSCTSGPLCLDRASIVLWPLELKKLIMSGMWLNYTWIHRATPDLRKECDWKLWLDLRDWLKGLRESLVYIFAGRKLGLLHPLEDLKKPSSRTIQRCAPAYV